MKLNITLFIVGISMAVFALYRLAPLNLKGPALTGFLIQTVPLAVCLAGAAYWLYTLGGTAKLEAGLVESFKVTSKFFPVIALLFPLMAFGGVLTMYYHKEIVTMLLGKFGYLGTLFAAWVIPTVNTVVGAVIEAWKTPAVRPLIQYYLTASALVCWPIFFFRVLGLNWEIGAAMYRTNWIVAIAIAPGFMLWSKAVECGGWWEAFCSIGAFGWRTACVVLRIS